MAKLKGLLKIEGTLDNLTFYKTQDGHLVRTKGGVSGDRIANDPVFVRTRENGAEFGAAAESGKLLRNTVRTLMLNAADNRVTSRITKIMTQIKDYDAQSARGERNVGIGILDPNAVQMLKGFDFNKRSVIGAVLYAPFSVNQSSGDIVFNSFTPINDLAYPAGATHVTLRNAFAIIDFAAGTSDITFSQPTNLLIDGTNTAAYLQTAGSPSGNGTRIFLMMLEFFQEVNGVQYSLKNGAYNVLSIVDIV